MSAPWEVISHEMLHCRDLSPRPFGEPSRCRLWTAREIVMKQFPGENLAATLGNIGALIGFGKHHPNAPRTPVALDEHVEPYFRDLFLTCTSCNLPIATTLVTQLMKDAASASLNAQTLALRLEALLQTMTIELHNSGPLFMLIERDKSSLWENPALFGSQVGARFPEAAFDIEEAGNCLAAGRSTGAVFHLIRVMEVLLKSIASALAIPDPVKEAERNWGSMLKKIRERIDVLSKERGAAWKSHKDFFDHSYTLLLAVKDAWRNPVMHVEAKYTDPEAMRIYHATKGFAEHLAIALPTPAA